MRILGYIRVSTNQQNNGVEVQREAIEKYSAITGIPLAKIFIDDGVSGQAEKRVALESLLEHIQIGDLLVVHKRDRIGRSMEIMVDTERKIKKLGARIISTMGEGTDSQEECAPFLKQIIDAFSEHERRVISNRIRRVMKEKKLRNELVGRVPYGKKLSIDGIHLEDNNHEKKTINKMIQLYQVMSLNKTAHKLNQLGLFNRDNILWHRCSIDRIINRNKPINFVKSRLHYKEPI